MRDTFVSRQEVTTVVVEAVEPERVELPGVVAAGDQAVRAAAVRVQTGCHDVTDFGRPFALDANQRWTQIEDQVEALVVQRTQTPRPSSTATAAILASASVPF
jgi:hypothetical protein